MPIRALPLVLAFLAVPAAAQPALTDGEVRALAARQTRALNAGDLSAYFGAFAPAAVFTQQALGSDNAIVPYGSSTVAEARAQLGRALAKSRIAEAVEIEKVVIDPTGRGAALAATVRTRIETQGRIRESCARRLMTFARLRGSLKALRQTDTLVRCRRPA